jgi:hypothetical protein
VPSVGPVSRNGRRKESYLLNVKSPGDDHDGEPWPKEDVYFDDICRQDLVDLRDVIESAADEAPIQRYLTP